MYPDIADIVVSHDGRQTTCANNTMTPVDFHQGTFPVVPPSIWFRDQTFPQSEWFALCNVAALQMQRVIPIVRYLVPEVSDLPIHAFDCPWFFKKDEERA